MPNAQDAVDVVSSMPHSPSQVTRGDFDLSAATATDKMETVAELQVKRLTTVRQGSYDLDLVAYESFPSDSTTGDTDTFDLNHYPMESPSVAEGVVLYAGGERVADADFSVDFAANTLDYSGDETANDLHVFYTSAQQARYEIRKVAPNGTTEKLDEGDFSLVLRQDANKDPLAFEFDHPLQGVLPAYWRLQIRVDGPYVVRWTADAADGTARADQMLADLPVNIADREAPEWVDNVLRGIAGAR